MSEIDEDGEGNIGFNVFEPAWDSVEEAEAPGNGFDIETGGKAQARGGEVVGDVVSTEEGCFDC